MNQERWLRVKELFELASKFEPAERCGILREACGEDEMLRAEVESLLESSDSAGDFIEEPALDPEATLLEKFAIAGYMTHSGSAGFDVAAYERSSGPKSMIGRLCGPYRIVDEMGEGGMGKVYRAIRADDAYQRQVAIKVVKRGMDTDFIIRRFRTERQILAGLNHPNITRLLDGGTTEDGLPFFVMELVEGLPIHEYCDSKKLPVTERLRLFLKVCSAVQYAHQNLIVHRDLKPRNILVTVDGEPKLLDFGIAKLLNLDLSSQTIDPTMSRSRLMTPEYASPEQARGETITTASDIYSLGVILYELLSGRRPYRVKADSPQEIARVIAEVNPPRPNTAVGLADETDSGLTPDQVSANRGASPERLRRHLRGDLDNIVLMAMRKEPSARYSTAQQFAEDIRRYLAGKPVTARKVTLVYRTSKFAKRHSLALIAALLSMVAIATGASITVREHRRADRRFEEVRRMANSFIFEIHDAIERVPNSLWARELLVKRALEYLDNLAHEASDDPQLMSELAAGYKKLGDVQGSPGRPNMGNTAGALESYRKANALRVRLAERDPDGFESKRQLADSYTDLSAVLNVSGEQKKAMETARNAVALLEMLLARNANNAQILHDMATAYQYLGNAYVLEEDWKNVAECRRKTLSIQEGQLSLTPADVVTQHDVSQTLQTYGAILAKLHDRDGALRQYRRAIEMNEKAVAADPENENLQNDLAACYYGFGYVMTELGDREEAVYYYRKALPIREKLVAGDRNDVQKRLRLAAVLQDLASLARTSGDLKGARVMFHRVVEIRESILNIDRVSADNRGLLARAYAETGFIAGALANGPDRADELHQCIRWEQKSLDAYGQMKGGSNVSRDLEEASRALTGCQDALRLKRT